MDGLDIAGFVVMAIIAAMAIGLFIFLGGWPGRIAKKYNHPYNEAITIGGWVTLLFGGVGWPFILIWAYAPPGGTKRDDKVTSKPDTESEGGE